MPSLVPKGTIDDAWILNMMNWDMETDPHFKKYKDSLSKDEQGSLGNQWCKYMEACNAWVKLHAFCKYETLQGIRAFVGGEIFKE